MSASVARERVNGAGAAMIVAQGGRGLGGGRREARCGGWGKPLLFAGLGCVLG